MGLYQVHSNIYEWTQDCFNKRYTEGKPVNGALWLEGDCTQRMVRGGEWGWSANKIRAGAPMKRVPTAERDPMASACGT